MASKTEPKEMKTNYRSDDLSKAVHGQAYDIVEEENMPIQIRDGTILRADIYRPDISGRFPGLLFRTPYDKRRSDYGRETYIPVAREAAKHGYVVVMQDVRGRFESNGEFYPFFAYDQVLDAEDGFDTVEWVASLPYCDGKVGSFGDSYSAWTQWELARLRPPKLVAMLPSGMPATALDYPILRVRRVLWLMYRMAPETRRRSEALTVGPETAQDAYSIWETVEREKWLWFLPWKDLPSEVLGQLSPYFYEFLDRIPIDYVAHQRQHDQIVTPTLHLTGWFDISVSGSIQHYNGMVSNGMTEHARKNQKLVIGPWTHMDPFYDLPRQTGDLDFGVDAVVDYINILTLWFDYWLKGIDNGIMDEPPIKLFIMGANIWRFEHEWPLARTEYTDYYFHSKGAANSPESNGLLNTTLPDDEPSDTYIYDPRDPVMSTFSRGAYFEPQDQKPLAYRSDILVYMTEPLGQNVEVTGPITVQLWAASTAVDIDFTAKLVDVFLNGPTIGLCSGIVRACYRESIEVPTLIVPGKVYQYTIKLEPTAYVFKVGHRIRLDISSSDFPNFDRNHNTGANYYEDKHLVSAKQTIFHDITYPSKITLPIVPR
jgi:hypothetical protein